MAPRPRRSLAAVFLLRWLALAPAVVHPLAHAQRGDAPEAKPLSPEEARQRFRVPPGFEVQLVASEPELQKPLNINFDSAGRVWVTGSELYPWPARHDARGEPIATFQRNLEDNFAAFRGLSAVPETATEGRDTIRVLSEIGRDGRARRITTFADRLNIPVGVQPLPRRPGAKGDTVIAFSIPAIWRLEDVDGDGRADVREKLYDGFGFNDTHGMVASFVQWFDGWIYGTHGFRNRSDIRDLGGNVTVLTSGNTYRFRADGSGFQLWTQGQTNPFGLTFDDHGDLYSADSHSKPVYLLQRGGYYEGALAEHDGLGFAPAITSDNHGSSAIAGIASYSATHFPAEYRGNLFNGNPVTRRVNRVRLDWHGSTPGAVRLEDFITSDDPSFRPVQVKLGPDGALWIADFCNPIIAHYEIPLAHPSRDKTHGRIWRVVWRGLHGEVPAPTMPNFAQADIPTLTAKLNDPNLTVRMLAVNELVERIGLPALPAVRAAAREASALPGAVSAPALAFALERLGAGDDALRLETMLAAGEDAGVAALRLLAERPDLGTIDEAFFARLIAATTPGHRWRQCAEVFARHPRPWQGPVLVEMHARTPAADAQLRYALSLALKHQVLAGTKSDLERWAARSPEAAGWIADVCLAVPTSVAAEYLLGHLERTGFAAKSDEHMRHAVRHLPADRFPLVESLAQRLEGTSLDQRLALAEGLAAATLRPEIELSSTLQHWMRKILFDGVALPDAARARRALGALGEGRIAGKNGPLGLLVLNPQAAALLRRDAIHALTLDAEGTGILLELIRRRGDSREEILRQTAAERLVDRIGRQVRRDLDPAGRRPDPAEITARVSTPAARAALAAALPDAPTGFAVVLAAGLAMSDAGADELLRLVEEGVAPAALLRHLYVSGPLQSRPAALRQRAARLTADLPGEDSRLEALIKLRTDTYDNARVDPTRGATLYAQHCAACHRHRNEGGNLGPSLDGIAARGVQRIIEDILAPGRVVDPAYRLATLITRDGASHVGMNLRDTGDTLVVRDPATGEDIPVRRSELAEITRNTASPMPPVFEHSLTAKDLHDLIAYLRGDAPPDSPLSLRD